MFKSSDIFIGGSDIPIIMRGSEKDKARLIARKLGAYASKNQKEHIFTEYDNFLNKLANKSFSIYEYDGANGKYVNNLLDNEYGDYIEAAHINYLNNRKGVSYTLNPYYIKDEVNGFYFEVDGYSGKTDKEILIDVKTYANKKELENNTLQLQFYMDILDVETAFLIYYKTDGIYNRLYDSKLAETVKIDKDDKKMSEIREAIKIFRDAILRTVEEFNGNIFKAQSKYIEIATGHNYEDEINELVKKQQEYERLKKEIDDYKDIILNLCSNTGVRNILTDNNSGILTMVDESVVQSIDSKKLRETLPEIAEEFTKVSKRKSHIRYSK